MFWCKSTAGSQCMCALSAKERSQNMWTAAMPKEMSVRAELARASLRRRREHRLYQWNSKTARNFEKKREKTSTIQTFVEGIFKFSRHTPSFIYRKMTNNNLTSWQTITSLWHYNFRDKPQSLQASFWKFSRIARR